MTNGGQGRFFRRAKGHRNLALPINSASISSRIDGWLIPEARRQDAQNAVTPDKGMGSSLEFSVPPRYAPGMIRPSMTFEVIRASTDHVWLPGFQVSKIYLGFSRTNTPR